MNHIIIKLIDTITSDKVKIYRLITRIFEKLDFCEPEINEQISFLDQIYPMKNPLYVINFSKKTPLYSSTK